MEWFGSRKRKALAALVVLLVAVVVVGVVADNNTSSPSGSANGSGASSSGSGSGSAQGTENTNGPASFIGHASNAVMFIQWTRSGPNVTGSLREAITKTSSLGLESDSKAFTGVIAGNGITLNVHGALGEGPAYVGEIKQNGFMLTVPGQGSNLITISFAPGEVSGYDEATKQLLLSRYPSPCTLYVSGHEVRVAFTGPKSAEDCAAFVQKASGGTEWTTAPQEGAQNGGVVCEVTNLANEKAVVTDNGGQSYGKEACTQLSGEGWG
ncbi:MAG TPA: hypothetical protein VGN13_07155 [Solirubrobacteraceae bacterium]|jgi:hypothetical protein